jgi:UDP-N-acetylglucosamine 4,6-dehydratase/5-epimerase
MRNPSNILKNKKLLITGGTGSFGSTVLKDLIHQDLKEIIIFSRDEKKQDDLRKVFPKQNLKFVIGDVRDYQACLDVTRNVDFIFHAAALKQVPSCEFYPMEACKTNVLGTENILNSAIFNEVSRVVCLSTDKAVHPINAMGISKALMEKVAIAKSRNSFKTKICITRYGNVMASRGSVIPLFFKLIERDEPLTITEPSMTRFMMTLSEAVSLVLFAFEHAQNGDILIQKSPAASIQTLLDACQELFIDKEIKKKVIGFRHGEKLHETLCSAEELSRSEDLGDYIRIPSDSRDLNYDSFYTEGQNRATQDYTSENTTQLSSSQLATIISKLDFEVE